MRESKKNKSNKNNGQTPDKHEFAFFLSSTSILIKPIATETTEAKQTIHIEDPELFHRLAHITRLKIGDTCILFDQKHHIKIAIQNYEKKKYITATVLEKKANTILTPNVTFLLPVLKKDYLETAVYSLTELGANTVQMLITNKSQKNSKLTRLSNISAAAAEQSKNFAFPNILEPVALQDYLQQAVTKNTSNIFFDPEGEDLHVIVSKIIRHGLMGGSINESHTKIKEITLMIGPEGDLTKTEKQLLIHHGFIFCKLTPTVLRSCQAVAVGLGALRTLLR